MKALHSKSRKNLEFWQVDKSSEQPNWVQKAFADGGFRWNEKSLAINNVGGLLKMSVPLGDYMVYNGKYLKAVPERKFKAEYRVL